MAMGRTEKGFRNRQRNGSFCNARWTCGLFAVELGGQREGATLSQTDLDPHTQAKQQEDEAEDKVRDKLDDQPNLDDL